MSEEPRNKFRLNKGRMLRALVQGHTLRQLDELFEYFEELERKFESDKKRISLRYEEAASKSKLDPEEESELAEFFSEEFHIIENTFLKTFRYSMVVTLCSVIEVALNDLCRYICHLKKYTLSLDDLRDDGLKRAESYLTKVCAIDFRFYSPNKGSFGCVTYSVASVDYDLGKERDHDRKRTAKKATERKGLPGLSRTNDLEERPCLPPLWVP